MPEMIKVFVYGTLMRGQRNHDFIEDSEFLYEKKTKPLYSLYSLGAYPAMAGGGEISVSGEVFLLTKKDLKRIDCLEGHPKYYERKQIELEDGEIVDTYLMPEKKIHQHDGILIRPGNWKKFNEVVNSKKIGDKRA